MARHSAFHRDFRDLHGEDPDVIDVEITGRRWQAPQRPSPHDPAPGWSPLQRAAFAVPMLLLCILGAAICLGLIFGGLAVLVAIIKGS